MHMQVTHSFIRFPFIVGLTLILGATALCAEQSIFESSPVKTIYIVQLSHLDIGFTDTQAAAAKKSAETIDRVIELCAEDEDYKWTIESLWQLEQWMAGKSPAQIEKLMSLVRAGRISLGACYAGMLSGLMGSEELCRSMYFAERLRREYGVEIETAIQNDIPGYSWAYPQILRKSGVKYFLTGINTLIGPGAEIPVKDRPFYWEGPDGSRVLTYICSDPEVGGGAYLLALWNYGWGKGGRAEETVPALLERLEKAGYPYDAILVMAGTGDNAGTHLSMTQGAREWNSNHESPKMVIAAPEEFFRHMEAEYAGRFPVYRGDWSGLWDQNAQGIPYGMTLSRRVHDELPQAEALAAFADILGLRAYPKRDLDFAWENVITYDEHSGGGGWPGTLTKEQTLEGTIAALGYARTALKHTAIVRRNSIRSLSSEVRISGDGVFVWNPTPWDRAGFVRVRLDSKWFFRTFDLIDGVTGQPVLYQKVKPTREIIFRASDVPGLGYKAYQFARHRSGMAKRWGNGQSLSLSPAEGERGPAFASDGVAVGVNRLENEFLRLEVGPAGVVTSLCDKRTGKELVDGKSPFGFGQLVKAVNTRMGPSRGEPVPLERPSVRPGLAGPLAGSLIVTDPNSPLSRTEITMYAGQAVVRFHHAFDLRRTPHVSYDDGGIIYDIAYPLDIPEGVLLFDTPAGLLDPAKDYMPKAFPIINVQHGGDICNRDYGVTFASRQAFNWEFERVNWLWGSPIPPDSTALMMRLLRKCDEAKYKDGVGDYRVEPGSPRVLTFESAFLLHSGGSDFDREEVDRFLAAEANPLLAASISANSNGTLPAGSGQLINLQGTGFVLLTFKRADDGDGYVLRLMETAGHARSIQIRSGVLNIRAAELVDNVERSVKSLSVRKGEVELTLGPREVAAVAIRFGEPE